MSRPINNLALTCSEVRFKTFVKERNEPTVETKKQNKFKLAFDGTGAKLAYDEIISQQSQRKSLPKKSKSKNDNKVTNSSSKSSKTIVKNVETNVNKLFKAIESADIDFIKLNFNSKNVNVTDQFGWTPLMSAAYSGHFDIVNFLLMLGADLKAKDKSGLTAMDLAAKKNHLQIISSLKEHSLNDKINIERDKNSANNSVYDTGSKNEEGFYCETCKIFFKESSRNKHETSTLHVFNTKPKISNTFYGIPKQNKGYQMLLNTGWDEEGGLGPDGEGQKYPVKTILKRDRRGLGQAEKESARITHFKPDDVDAIRFVNRNKRKALKRRDWKKQLSRDAAKTRALRQALS
ncbi:G patch domain and ankyrin repeat-containing protein 1 homolog isoform X1 [Nasonia vitripennis]|uniref:G-patch domain-containing protein n=1 Tax=Nasonia vitripennis TaxID=7425 RepID=A0A7M7QY77_NASVI|nr:G patch domain and ankyrin repeat-containing protein 1 homolog isoform X1 [Nasonia vitripennis]